MKIRLQSSIINRQCYLLRLRVFGLNSLTVSAQSRKAGILKGTVKTSDGKPAEYVNVGIKGVKGTVVDKNGNYQIKDIAPGSYELNASYIGLESQIRQIEIQANQVTTVDFVLTENNQQLQE